MSVTIYLSGIPELGNLFSRDSRNYRIGEVATPTTAKTFLFRNSHVWLYDLIYPICSTRRPKSRDSVNLPHVS